MNAVCKLFGDELGDGYYTFPDISKLSADKVEATLRTNGFGYRAKYIQKASQQIVQNGGLKWFEELQDMSYEEAHKNLLTLHGIGPKVADCICLMSLNQMEAIPVDTHVFQIAKRYFDFKSSTKNISPKLYSDISNKFRETYGKYAGEICSHLRTIDFGICN